MAIFLLERNVHLGVDRVLDHMARAPYNVADEGIMVSEDVEECFRLQQTSYSGTPMGQILVLRGYLTQLELARIVAQQQSFRRMFCVTLDASFAQSGDERAPPIAS